MAVVTPRRQRRKGVLPVEDWQREYLYCRLPARLTQRDFQPRPSYYWWLRLVQGERPPLADEAKATPPWRLWEIHRETVLAEWIRHHPGTRPLPFWMWDAPGAIDPDDMDRNHLKWRRARALASERAAWPPEKQRAFLSEHGLLGKNE